MNTEFSDYPVNGSPPVSPAELSDSDTKPHPTVTGPPVPQGARRALCIGIDQYNGSPLNGCVNDARRWGNWFRSVGFQTEWLLDQDATYENIRSSIENLIVGSKAGDVIAIQYAGHGTKMPDLNEDELGGDTPGYDEALVPIDHLTHGYLIDDDLAAICDEIPEGVGVTYFFDCCHSGTAVRTMVGRSQTPVVGSRPRFLPASQTMIDTHIRTRRNSRNASRTKAQRREVLFAACKSSQLAWESDGQGDFTRHALGVLEASASRLTNAQFNSRVNLAFGGNARQNPQINCDDSYLALPLLSLHDDSEIATGSDTQVQKVIAELRGLISRFS